LLPAVKLIIFVQAGRFGDQLLDLVAGRSHPARFISFLVDDLIYFDDVNMLQLIDMLVSLSFLFVLLFVEFQIHVDLFKCDHSCQHLQDLHPEVLSIHPKLHPGICWSHAASKPCARPPLRWMRLANPVADTQPATTGAWDDCCLVFRRSDGTGDWDYPWDLCGAVYRAAQASAFCPFGMDQRIHWEWNRGRWGCCCVQ
jgi:hypothetical protein